MTNPPELTAEYEPTVETIELVCDRLADLGLAVGPDTARQVVRAILAAEAPRFEARLHEALTTSLETIQIATQSAIGILTARMPAEARRREHPEAQPSVPRSSAPAPGIESRRPIARRRPDEQPRQDEVAPARSVETDRPREPLDEGGKRPVFKRPRGR